VLIERSLHTHYEHWQHFQSVFLSLDIGQIQHLPRRPVGFEKNTIRKNNICAEILSVSVELQCSNRKIGNFVTLYQRELFKNIPRLGTFCTQSVNEGLMACE
jgi:hypothetical protein